MTVNLEELAKEISAAGEKVKELKTNKGEKAEVDAAVKLLLEKKQLYADNNEGMGVDGKPFGKKKNNGGGGGGGNKQPEQVGDGFFVFFCRGIWEKIQNWLMMRPSFVSSLFCLFVCLFIVSYHSNPRAPTPKMPQRRQPRRMPKRQPSQLTRLEEVPQLQQAASRPRRVATRVLLPLTSWPPSRFRSHPCNW
jgi:hypothetical protein